MAPPPGVGGYGQSDVGGAAPVAAMVAATPHGPDVPLMAPPLDVGQGQAEVQPRMASPATMYPDAHAPQVLSYEGDRPKDLKIVDDSIIGSQRIVTVAAPTVERATGHDARQMAWQQRVQGGWVNAGIEALDYYPVDGNGQLIQDRSYRGPYTYHSRWRLTLTG